MVIDFVFARKMFSDIFLGLCSTVSQYQVIGNMARERKEGNGVIHVRTA